DGAVKLYGAGTAAAPGALLQSTDFTISGAGLKTLVLSTPVHITGTEDIWVSIEWEQLAAGYPFGIDAGPQIDAKGGFLYYSGAWYELQDLGLDYNWVLEAKVEGAALAHDTGVTSIITPASGIATGAVAPQVTVKNFGANDETNVPVDMAITRYGTPVSIWDDGFETFTPGGYVLPAGWTIETTNPTGTWYMYSSSTTYSASTYPRVQEATSDGNAQDESLISPTIDCSALTTVNLMFTKYYYHYTGDVGSFTVYGSNDNGATWPYTLATYTATSSVAENIDISTWAAGQNDVKIKFRFQSAADAGLNSYLYFDNFWVGHNIVPAWGPLGDNPPAGWTISNSPTNPSPWTNNFWHRYTSLYTSYDSMYYPARVYYTSPYEDVNVSLITPSIDCSALSTVNLYANGYFYYYASYPGRGYIEVSTDGGSTWTDTGALTTSTRYFYEYDVSGIYGNNVDITSWAAGQSNVKIRFRYEHTAAETSRYWYLGNVRVGSDRNNIIFRDSFNGVQAYSTNFKIWSPDVWTNWDWNVVTGTSTGNKWMNVISGTSPTCTPPEGARMAEYNAYSASSGNQARIYTDGINVAAANALKVSFQMFHDSVTYQTTPDQIEVQASVDNGATWTTVSDPFYRSCTLQGLPLADGWQTWIVDLTDYADETNLRIGFLATSAYGYNMFIDDVEVFDPGLITDYSQTAYCDVAAGQTVTVTFPAWTPFGWQNPAYENSDITFDVAAETDLTGDLDPSNDGEVAAVTLHFPYLHDLQALSIESPITSGPAETQEVKATIMNMGQYPERNFFVPVSIGAKIYSTDGYFNNFEANDGGFVQSGNQWEWGAPTTGPGAAYSGTKLWATKLAGNYVAGLATLTTDAISVPIGGDLTYWHWYDFEASYDGYNVKIATSPYTTWTLMTPVGGYTGTANSANPLYPQPIWSGHVQKFWEYETFDLAAYEGQTVKFRFDMGADSSVFYPGVYFDDMLVGTLTVTIDPEYDESAAVASWLYPGETIQLIYPDWTPENLAIGTSGAIEYGVQLNVTIPADTNAANNVLTEDLVLDYWHDIGIKSIVSPSAAKGGRDVLFHQRPFTPTESWTFRTSASTYLCQDNFWDLTAPIGNIEFYGLCLIYSAGWTPGNANTLPFEVKFYEAGSTPGAVVATFPLAASTPVNTGQSYSGFTMYKWTYDLPTAVPLAAGWMSIQSTTAPDGAWLLWAGSPEGDLLMYQQGATTPQIAGDSAFNLSGTASPTPPVQLYLAPGVQSISNIVTNLGVFVETGLTCYAEIWEYISSENGTLVMSDEVTGITLDPMGDEETLTFDSYDFQDEGVFGLKFNFPLASDDIPTNNVKTLGIGIDNTAPISTHAISPAAPNGQNGWYISNPTITLTATDPEVNGVASKVDKIEYRIAGGSWMTYTAPFQITVEGAAVVVEYRAVDKVGNIEDTNAMPALKIDKTIPTILLDYTWEKIGTGKYAIIVTATCNDVLAGMGKVEFYYNQELQETVTGAGPEFVWTYQWAPLPKVTVKAIAYDNAGWTNFAEIYDPVSTSAQSQTTTLLTQPLVK
ncbi:MAG: hypothetical protein WC525_05410, partial [Candidatus Thermoplasmatota archaeon]